jgi:hypothetical protein
MQNVPVIENADGRRRAAAGVSAPLIRTAVSRVMTLADFVNAGGHPHVQVTATSGSIDISLPADSLVPGHHITIFKNDPGANVAALATNGDTIEGSSPNRRYNNVTSERASVTLYSDGTQWVVKAQKGTWVVNNT